LLQEDRRVCNRYRMTAKELELARHFGIDVSKLLPEEQLPPPELFPKRIGWIVRQQDGQRSLAAMRWGVPLKMKGAKGQPVTKAITNVRNLASPFWKSTLGNLAFRCLVPVTTFCEWEGEAGAKRERWFSLPSAPIFAFAGVWRPGEEGNGFAFLTCEPNPLVAPIHPKAMPVILQPEDYERWLTDPYAGACDLAQPFPSQLMAVA
jgi:putative SOS response-associated peptidase YedK